MLHFTIANPFLIIMYCISSKSRCGEILLYGNSCQPLTMRLDFEGGVYWDELTDRCSIDNTWISDVATFRGWRDFEVWRDFEEIRYIVYLC